jgi:acyl-CoA synthetase (AMP-forming)/AMP-acid ligase II
LTPNRPDNPPTKLIALKATSSIAFVREVLDLYHQQIPFVILRAPEHADALRGFEIERTIEPAEHPSSNHGWIHHEPTQFCDANELAQVTFSSGTEGTPKAIALSHRALADVVERVNGAMKIDSSIKEYIGVPTSYSFGLGRVRACAAVGGSTYIPERGFDPVELAAMLEKNEINAFSAVPTLIRTVLGNPELFAAHATKLRWIEIGSQYMSGDEKRQLRELFPNASIVQHYGLTEASRTTFLDISNAPENALESVGQPTGESKVRIADDGRIEIAGPHAAMGLLTSEGITPIVDDSGWLCTNDLGEMRDGFLFFKGRADDQINCGGVKLSPDAIEQKLCDRLGIKQGITIARVPDPVRGDGILLCYTPQTKVDEPKLAQITRSVLEEMGLKVGTALHIQSIAELPTTGSGKVQRSKLAELYQPVQIEIPATAPEHPNQSDAQADTLEAKLIHAWRVVLRQESVSLHTSFYEHGGDSLSSIALMLALEKAHIDRAVTARVFDGETIAQIVETHDQMQAGTIERAPRTNDRIAGDTINAVRGMLVLWLIGIHFLPGVWERLPVDAEEIKRWLNPLYRMGTPGFAIVFGLGVGYFFLTQIDHKAPGVFTRIRIATVMVAIGIALLGAARFARFKFVGYDSPAPFASALIYSVLLYYFFAVTSIPLWHRLLSNPAKRVASALILAAISFGIHYTVQEFWVQKTYSNPLAELVSLMVQAKYNYFFMTGTVMLGVAAGAHFHQSITHIKEQAKSYIATGLTLIAASLIVAISTGEISTWLDMGKPTLTILIGYLGIIIFALGAMIRILSTIPRSGILSSTIAALAACGVLSLPLFIGHELVVPCKDILVEIGLPGGPTLLASLGVFFVVGAYFVRRVMRIYS